MKSNPRPDPPVEPETRNLGEPGPPVPDKPVDEAERLRGEVARLQATHDRLEKETADSVARLRDARIENALVDALREEGCLKPELFAPALAAGGEYEVDDEGVLRPADPSEVDVSMMLRRFAAEVPTVFRRPARPNGQAGSPRLRYDEWRDELGSIR